MRETNPTGMQIVSLTPSKVFFCLIFCRICFYEDIEIITRAPESVMRFASHAITIFQALDLSPLSAEKQRNQCELPLSDHDQAAGFLTNMYHDFNRTLIKVNISGTFQKLVFSYHTSHKSYVLLFDREEEVRQSDVERCGGFTSASMICRAMA
jgi:hypothetical protein